MGHAASLVIRIVLVTHHASLLHTLPFFISSIIHSVLRQASARMEVGLLVGVPRQHGSPAMRKSSSRPTSGKLIVTLCAAFAPMPRA